MIWRDGDYIKFQYDEWHYYVCLIDEIDQACELLRDWFVYRGYTYVFTEQLYQSFLLDYIEYLFESAIERHLAEEDLKRQQRQFEREQWIREAHRDLQQRDYYRSEYNNEIL